VSPAKKCLGSCKSKLAIPERFRAGIRGSGCGVAFVAEKLCVQILPFMGPEASLSLYNTSFQVHTRRVRDWQKERESCKAKQFLPG